ncbi:MAG: DUF5660 domain-containing protein [Candidatus Roizmanbacteria bacterium]|nr:DUF5660 domain-containing protein [Candidatus Roizmanbacteria bacterium]
MSQTSKTNIRNIPELEAPFPLPQREARPGTEQMPRAKERTEPVRVRHSEVVFNRGETMEQARIRSELQRMIEHVQEQLKALKMQDQALAHDISKLVLEGVPEKPGMYHVRFFEFVSKLLDAVGKSLSKGKHWLDATFEKISRKKFRGKAKTHGTSFSRSNELTQANTPG